MDKFDRDLGVDANELATLAKKFIKEQHKNKKKTA